MLSLEGVMSKAKWFVVGSGDETKFTSAARLSCLLRTSPTSKEDPTLWACGRVCSNFSSTGCVLVGLNCLEFMQYSDLRVDVMDKQENKSVWPSLPTVRYNLIQTHALCEYTHTPIIKLKSIVSSVVSWCH